MSFSLLPVKLAKLTLLSYVTGGRAMLVYSYAALLLSVWALGELSRMGGVGRVYSLLVSVGVAVLLANGYLETSLRTSFSMKYALLVIVWLTGLSYLLLRGKKQGFAIGIVMLSLAAGATVNPLHLGAGALLNSPISKAVQQIDAESDRQGLWLASTQNNVAALDDILLYANGAHSLGGIHNYPDEKLWKLLDPTGSSHFIYNRSAHISFELTKGKTSFELYQQNAFHVQLSVSDLKKLRVRYLLSNMNLIPLQLSDVRFQLKRKADRSGLAIYEVSYR